ncbi:MAG TPA: hypothetical protein VNC41_18840, partial [Acidimicrobiia bacterium]|nr:hypothetical protein [Acidimicrobiia bacterium]
MLIAVVLTAALLPAIANPDAAHADGTGMIISEIPNGSISAAIPGIVMPGNIIVSADGTTNPGDCTVSGPASPEGCLVIGSTAVTSNVRISDGFELMGPPGPAEWDPIARSAEATIANLRGVPADTQNQYWARSEINALTLVKLFELISKKADGERLTYDENRALKRLSDAYRNYEIAAAEKALDFYTLWKNNPCGFRVPVGNTPDSYRKLLGTACGSRVFSLVTHVPAPSPDLFTGWGREHSQSEDVYAPLARSMQNYNRDLGPEEAKAEVKREYQELVGSLQAGMAFLA